MPRQDTLANVPKKKKIIFFLDENEKVPVVGNGRETPVFAALLEGFQKRVRGAKMVKIHSVRA